MFNLLLLRVNIKGSITRYFPCITRCIRIQKRDKTHKHFFFRNVKYHQKHVTYSSYRQYIKNIGINTKNMNEQFNRTQRAIVLVWSLTLLSTDVK